MFPLVLIQALFGLGGVCLLLFATIFHYFKDRVDQYEIEKASAFFSSPANAETIEAIKDGSLPSVVFKDFNRQLFNIGKPRRRFRNLLLFLPITGGSFLLSASLACVIEMENEFVTSIATTLELLAYFILFIAIVAILYCIYQLVKLARELT